jgi:GNAT superfamily N-acetyltransferase
MNPSSLRIESLSGRQIGPRLQELAALRIEVFHEWPYLYQGSMEYESHYLERYAASPRGLVVLVWDEERCVGASTALPLTDASAEIQQPFRDADYALDSIDYFGESLLLHGYRGRGLGVEFFARREAHARAHGFPFCAFCAVDRDRDDPRQPQGYVPNDAFWMRRGYRRHPELQASYSWPDIGEIEGRPKRMTFWLRATPPAP